jgi:hypothetical protein
MADREHLIRERAYLIWEHEGQPEGQAERHWQEAEREIEALEAAADESGGPLTGKEALPPEPGPM